MDLMPKVVRDAFPRWRSTDDGRAPESIPVVVKHFTPDAGASWFITEAAGVLDDDNGTEVPVANCTRARPGAPWLYHPGGGAAPKLVEDIRLFGWCDLGLGFPELGYVSLNELESLRGPMRLPVERDLYYRGSLADAMEGSR